MYSPEDSGALIHPVAAGAPHAQASSATQVGVSSATGDQIDREALPRHYQSAKVAVPFRATVATARKVTVGIIVKHRSATVGAGSTWSNYATGNAAIDKTTTTATFNGRSVAALSVNLRAAKRYLKVHTTKTFNSTSSGANVTVEAPVVVFGGANQNPAAG